MVKFDVNDYSCVFAIKNLENVIKLSLCITPQTTDIYEVNVDGVGLKENVNFDVYEDLSINWVDIYIVFDKTITIYTKCLPTKSLEPKEKMDDVYFSSDDWIYIAQSGVEDSNPFRVSDMYYNNYVKSMNILIFTVRKKNNNNQRQNKIDELYK